MRFESLMIAGAVRVQVERKVDTRGFFARTFCRVEFRDHGLPTDFVQASLSHNERRGTVRGLHFQWPPSQEAKLVRCTRGAVFDVLLDLRPHSPSYLQHVGVVLDATRHDAVFIPHGVAHGFQTLADDCEVFYEMTDYFAPELSAGVRWNDPYFGISWPLACTAVSERDAGCTAFERCVFEAELAGRAARVDGGRS